MKAFIKEECDVINDEQQKKCHFTSPQFQDMMTDRQTDRPTNHLTDEHEGSFKRAGERKKEQFTYRVVKLLLTGFPKKDARF